MSKEQRVSGRRGYNMTLEQEKEASRYVAQEINLIEFATKRLGWQIDTAQEDDRGVVLNHEEHATIIASPRPDPESGEWEFVSADGTHYGRLSHLLSRAGWGFSEIYALKDSPGIEQFTRPYDKPYEGQREQDPVKQTKLAEQRFSEVKLDTEPSCLEQYGINEEIYAEFPQVKAHSEGATFKLYNIVDGRMHVCSTVKYASDSKGGSKYFLQRDLPRGLVVLKEDGPVERIVVSGSPISALSFKQLEQMEGLQVPKTMYVSTCFTMTLGMEADITYLFKQAKELGQSIVVARDNEFISSLEIGEVSELAEQQGLVVHLSSPPRGNYYWNDYLKSLQSQKQYPELTDAELKPAQQYDSFFKNDPVYKNTFVEQLGISEKACKDMRGYVTKEDVIFFPIYTSFQDACSYKPIGTYRICIREGNHLHRDYERRGVAPGLVVLPTKERSDSIVVTADPLDIFKHRTEQQAKFKDNSDSAPITTYVSTCHQDAIEVKEPLKALLEDQKHSHVTLYMNPEAAEKLKSQLGNEIRIDGQLQPLKCDTYTPSQAAWEIDNGLDAKEGEAAVLVPQEEVQKEVIQATDPQPNTVNEEATMTASKESEPVHILQASLNKTPAYERTLLEQLEIPQKACQSIKGYKAGEKQITFPLYADSKAVKEQKPMGSYQFKLEEKGLVDYTEARDKTPGLVVLPAQKAPNSVVITSSPLDIFLHRAEQQSQTSIWQQLTNPPATTYICTCGQAGKDLQEPLQSILSQHKDTNLVFYMNNREARDLRIHLDKSVLSDQSKGFAYKVSPPCQSLWHELSHKESQDTPKVVQEELWEQITPRQSQDKGIRMK